MLIKYKCDKSKFNACVNITALECGKNRITVELEDKSIFMPYKSWDTGYSKELIQETLNIKGPAYLCDEIMRDESPDYLQKSLKYSLLSFINEQEFENKRILDFGCGSGSSTVVLARMLKNTEIVGIDLEQNLLSLANSRAQFYGLKNLQFLTSPDSNSLPDNIGKFNYIILSAVYEHLLPDERLKLLEKLWSLLEKDGILFINGTPYRYFPIETHTTELPLINYLPDKFAYICAKKFSKRNLEKDNWQELLRKGIRGASIKEIKKILASKGLKFELIKPKNFGIKDNVDLWRLETTVTRRKTLKNMVFYALKLIRLTTGLTIVPNIALAIKKL